MVYMTLIILMLGIVAGISVGMPYGPVGFVIIRRFYLFGMQSGMVSALGAALSDAFYAVVVGFGLHKISHFLLSIAGYAEIIAGVSLVYIGFQSIKNKLHLHDSEEENHPFQDVTSAAFLNVLNPTLIFSYALVFTILAKILHGVPMTFNQTIIFIVGVVAGTCGLWFVIGSGIRHLRRKNRDELVQKINYVTGAILLVIGIVILAMSGIRYL